VSSFNYSNYVVEAVNSVLNQSVSFDEIIVVDDRSTDNSVEVLEKNFSCDERIKLILKEKNEGQLSCFNKGYLASTGDIIFFLDSDDAYKENYLEEALNFYKNHKDVDFLFCALEVFGNSERKKFYYECDRNLGYSLILTLYSQAWVGGTCSTISMRKKILDKILPIPYLEDWITRADDCLVFGASLVKARKFYMAKPLVRYRTHENNASHQVHHKAMNYNKPFLYQRYLNINRLFSLLCERTHYCDKVSDTAHLSDLAHLEFATIPNPQQREFLAYLQFTISSKSVLSKKIWSLLSITKHFFSQGKGNV
jgi:glycosyltransferase involved in cell wall biosynthesis